MFNLTARLRLKDQLSSKLSRVTKQLQRTSNSTSKASKNLTKFSDGMKKSSRNTNNLTSSLKGLLVKVGAVVGTTKLLKTTLGGAMKMETDKLTLTALIKDTAKANQLFDMLQRKGMKSVFSEEDFLGAGKAFLPLTKDLSLIDKLTDLTERLGASNPLQGMEGAAFSIRELLSGDYQSIVERFNLPRSKVREALKGANTIEKKIKVLDDLLNEMGFTKQFVFDVNASALSQWKMLTSNTKTAFAKMGDGAIEKIKPMLTKINEVMFGGGLDNMIGKGSDLLASGFEKLVAVAQWFIDNKDKIAGFFKAFSDNANEIVDVTLALGAALLTAKVGFLALDVIGKITTLLHAYRTGTLMATAAQMGLNLSMLANPFTWLIIGIAALVAIGVLLYRNWDKVKAKAIELWGVLTEKFTEIKNNITQAIESIKKTFSEWINGAINIGKDFVQNIVDGFLAKWDELMQTASNMWESITSIFDKKKRVSIAVEARADGSRIGDKADGSHYHGIDYVPRNGYVASLHKGERVQTAKEAKESRNGKIGSLSLNIAKLADSIVIREDADIEKLANALAIKILQAKEAGA